VGRLELLKNHTASTVEIIGIVDNMLIFSTRPVRFPSCEEIKYVNARNAKAKDMVNSLSQKNRLNNSGLFIVGKYNMTKTSVNDINPKLRIMQSKTLL
jgi:hypothetical protein